MGMAIVEKKRSETKERRMVKRKESGIDFPGDHDDIDGNKQRDDDVSVAWSPF
jgi:hypothetical protein